MIERPGIGYIVAFWLSAMVAITTIAVTVGEHLASRADPEDAAAAFDSVASWMPWLHLFNDARSALAYGYAVMISIPLYLAAFGFTHFFWSDWRRAA